LIIVIMFQTGSRLFDSRQRRKAVLAAVDERKVALLAKKQQALGA